MNTDTRPAWTPPTWTVRGLVCAVIVLLQALDALATLRFMSLGAEEANPLARYLLDVDDLYFFAMKTIGVGVLALCVAFGIGLQGIKPGVRRAFWLAVCGSAVVYALLDLIHLCFLFIGPGALS